MEEITEQALLLLTDCPVYTQLSLFRDIEEEQIL